MGKKKCSSSGTPQDTKTSQEKSWLIMNQVKPPEPFNFQESASASWTSWIKRYKTFHSAVGVSSASEEQQINMLLYCMGQEADELLDSLGMTEGKRTSFISVVATLEEYFTMKKTIFYHRALFLERDQRPGEKIDSYIEDISKLSEKCEWSCKECKSKGFKDEMILLKLITGLTDKSLSKLLQRREITTLTDGIKMLRQIEVGEDNINDCDLSKNFTSLRIKKENIKNPGTQVEDLLCVKRENKSFVNLNVKPAPSTSAIQNQECVPCIHNKSRNKFTFQEENRNMRASLSSVIDTGDECKRSVLYQPDDFDSDEEYECLKNIQDFHQNNYLSFTSGETWRSVKSTHELDDSWPELGKVDDDKPKYVDNYHFSVSGHQSRRGLRKMCQQRLKYNY